MWRRSLWEMTRPWGCAPPTNGISVLIKEVQRAPSPLHHGRTQPEVSLLWTRKQVLSRCQIRQCLDCGLPSFQNCRERSKKRGQTPNICSLLPTKKIWVASILNSKSSWDHRGLTYWGNTCALRAILGNSSQSWNALNPFLFWPRGNTWRAAYLLRMAGTLTWRTMDCVLHFFGS